MYPLVEPYNLIVMVIITPISPLGHRFILSLLVSLSFEPLPQYVVVTLTDMSVRF